MEPVSLNRGDIFMLMGGSGAGESTVCGAWSDSSRRHREYPLVNVSDEEAEGIAVKERSTYEGTHQTTDETQIVEGAVGPP